MPRLLSYLPLICVLLFSCEKDKMGQGKGASEPFALEIVYGNNQNGVFNQYITDSLVVRVSNSKNEAVEGTMVSFRVSIGDGDTSPDYMLSDSSGLAYTKYKADCFSAENKIIAGVYDSDQVLIDSVVFTIEGISPIGFGKSCGIEDKYLYESKFREHLGEYFFIANRNLYKSNSSGIAWEQIMNIPLRYQRSNVYDLQLNSKGWMYLINEDEGLYLSKDQGNWTPTNTGFVTTHSPACMLVTDSVILVSFYSQGLYQSDNNGEFWRKILIDGKYNGGYNFINRHPNGDLYLFDDSNKLWRSLDGGKSWVNMDLSREYIHSHVRSFLIGSNGMLYIGSENATLSVVSPESFTGSVHRIDAEYQRDVEHLQEYKGDIYFHLNNDIYSGTTNWKKIEIGFTEPIFNFHIKQDGTFLLASENGLYYNLD